MQRRKEKGKCAPRLVKLGVSGLMVPQLQLDAKDTQAHN